MTHVSHEGNTSDHLSQWLSKSRDRVLPHPSVIFYVKTSSGSPWVARTLSLLLSVKRGKVSSNSATVELLSFWGGLVHICVSTQLKACCRGITDTILNWHRRGLPPSELQISCDPLSLLPIQYSTLSPSCPARSCRRQQEHIANIIHIKPPSWEGVNHEWLSTTRLLPVAYISNHSQSIVLIHRGGNKV
jgi:hypothetical protein